MQIRELIGILVKLVETLTTWPAVVLLLVLLFRREVTSLLSDVGHRITKAPGGFEFSPASIQAFRDIIEISTEQFKDDPAQFLNFLKEELAKLLGTPTVTQNSVKPLSGRSILWIDKNQDSLEYAERIFQHLGARLIMARSSEEALKHLNKEPVDGVILNK